MSCLHTGKVALRVCSWPWENPYTPRYGLVKDPFGHHWAFATHIKDMTPDEMMQASKEAFADAPA